MTSSKALVYHHLMRSFFKSYFLVTANAVLCTETSVHCIHNQRFILRFTGHQYVRTFCVYIWRLIKNILDMKQQMVLLTHNKCMMKFYVNINKEQKNRFVSIKLSFQ